MSTETIQISEAENVEVKADFCYTMASRIMQETDFFYCLEDDKFYSFDNGYWKDIFEVEMLGRLTHRFKKLTKFSLAQRKQIVENLKTLKYKRLDDLNKIDLLNFENGMVNPYKNEIDEHNPIYYSTLRIPYKYEEFVQCPLWLKTLGEIFEGDQEKVNILQEFFGYCLTKETNQEKALLLLGESRSGKSTILNTLRYMLGVKNCSSVALKYIAHQQFTPMLINKLVNIDSDVSGKATDFEAEFKTITSGEPVTCNQKFVNTFEFNPFCKLVLAANEFPRITDHSSAFYKRLILLPCDRVFEEHEQVKTLKTDLLKELPGILNWAIAGFQRLNKRGKFEHKDFMAEAIAELREESNPIEVFFREHILIDLNGNGEIEKGLLYKRYEEWCKLNGNLPLSSVKFGKAFFNKYSKFTPKKAQSKATGKRIWKNLKYIETNIQVGEQVQWQD